MGKRSMLLAFVAALMVAAVAIPAGAGAKIPVSSVDNTADSLANRTNAVTNIVVAMNARLDRIHPPEPGLPPNPCSLELRLGCAAVLIAQTQLLSNINNVCRGVASEVGVAGVTITDSDAYADNFTASGLENQLFAVATVFNNASQRFLGVWYPPNPIFPNPGPRTTPEQVAAVNALNNAILTHYPPNPIYPPNPCSAPS